MGYMRTTAFLLLVVLCLTLLSCHDEKDPVTATPPVFSATPVDIGFRPADSAFGDILFLSPVLRPFGAILPPDSLTRSPGIEYFTRPGAPVRAVTYGIVDTIIENPMEEGDYDIRVVAMPGSDYLIVHRHVLTVSVLAGDQVKAGDTIGTAGTWTDLMRRTGLAVIVGEGNDTRAYCPLNYGDSAFRVDHARLLNEYTRRGFDPPYDTLCLTGPIIP
jgi:hypothetical protein